MTRCIVLAAGMFALVGCTPTRDFEREPFTRAVHLNENYQTVYARTRSAMRLCLAERGLESELYSDLGYGDIHWTQSIVGMPSAIATVRVQRAGTGSDVLIKTGNVGFAESIQNKIVRWAGGDTKCDNVWGG